MITLADTQPQPETTPAPEPWQQEVAQRYSWHSAEPNFVHSLKWMDPELQLEHMVVVRDDNLDALWVKIKTITQMVKASRAKQTVPTTGASSNGQADPSYCPKHQTLMTSKNGRYFHKAGVTADGLKNIWCRGK